MSFSSSQKAQIRICSGAKPAAQRALSQSPKNQTPGYKDVERCLGGIQRRRAVALTIRTVVGSGTMIYTEGFGAELVGAEPIFLNVGFTVSPMR
jgi:hypothetical protein